MKTFDSLKKFTAMIVFAVLFSNCSPNSDSAPATFPSDGLIAQYNFDGDANDSSDHDLNGTVHGATLTTDKNNKNNKAYDFDISNASFGNQNDEIYIPYSPLMNVNNITVSLWLYPRSYFWNGNTNNPYSTIINRFQYGYSNPNGQVWGITFNPTSVTAFIVGTNGTGSTNAVSNQSLTLNKWYHLVMTYNQNQVRLYINGRLAATQNYSNPMNTSGNSGISIGESNQANGYWNHTDGKIDDVAIWDRALTPTEIEALYSIQN